MDKSIFIVSNIRIIFDKYYKLFLNLLTLTQLSSRLKSASYVQRLGKQTGGVMHYLHQQPDSKAAEILEQVRNHLKQGRGQFIRATEIYRKARGLVPLITPKWQRQLLREHLFFLNKKLTRSSFKLDEFYEVGLNTQTALNDAVLAVEQSLPDDGTNPWISVYTHQIHGCLLAAQAELVLALATLQAAVLTDPTLVIPGEPATEETTH